MPENHFAEDVAPRYDSDSPEMFTPEALDPAVEMLAGLAGNRGALEFAIGTGRVALPLHARGVDVHGIELSEQMVAELRAKPGGRDVEVTIGDMSTTRVAGTFGVVYLVYNTIMNLTSQDEQVACFQNAADHLADGGNFVVEVGVPDLQRLPPGHTLQPFEVRPGKLGVDEFDLAEQGLISHHYTFPADATVIANSVPFRYVWPAELDLMARLAGMSLRHRWAGWTREPFTSSSRSHVSVWGRPR